MRSMLPRHTWLVCLVILVCGIFRTRAGVACPRRNLGDSVRTGQRHRHHRTDSRRVRLPEALGQQMIVEDIGGAGGTIAVSRVAKAAPDGYQIVLGAVDTFAQSQFLFKEPPYNSVDRFRADRAGDRTAAASGGSERIAGHQSQGICRLSESQSDEDAFRLGRYRRRAVSRLLDVDIGHRCNRDACALSKRRAGSGGHDQGRHRLLLSAIDIGERHDRKQIDQGAGGFDPRAVPAVSRCADRARTRIRRGRRLLLEGLFAPKERPEPIVATLNAALGKALDNPAVQSRLREASATVVAPDRRSSAYLRSF